jgi:hypothetical protein
LTFRSIKGEFDLSGQIPTKLTPRSIGGGSEAAFVLDSIKEDKLTLPAAAAAAHAKVVSN